jgi:hypothetical protein
LHVRSLVSKQFAFLLIIVDQNSHSIICQLLLTIVASRSIQVDGVHGGGHGDTTYGVSMMGLGV